MAELLHQLFAIEADFTPDFALQSRGLELLLHSDTSQVFVAEADEQVVGMCTVQIIISTAKGREVGIIEDVVVDLDYRNQGLGARMLDALEQWAVQRGLARLQLQADKQNAPALGFYRRQGWNHTNLIGWMKQL